MIKNLSKFTASLAFVAFSASAISISAQPAPAQQAISGMPSAPQLEPKEIIETYGFIVGLQSGLRDFELSNEEFDSFLKGLKRAQSGDPIPSDLNSVMPQLQAYLGQRQAEVAEKKSAENREKSEQFFSELKNKEGVQSTPEGLFYEIERKGDGETPDSDSIVRMNYEGRLIDGTVFDSSYERNEPAEFSLANVIPGMRMGVQKIQEGGKITLYIPAELAYGDQGQPTIPPGSALIFEVELIEVKEAPVQAPQVMPEFMPAP